MFVARHGIFLEKEFLAKRVSGSSVHLEEVQDEPQPPPNLEESQENLQTVAEPILEIPACSHLPSCKGRVLLHFL